MKKELLEKSKESLEVLESQSIKLAIFDLSTNNEISTLSSDLRNEIYSACKKLKKIIAIYEE